MSALAAGALSALSAAGLGAAALASARAWAAAGDEVTLRFASETRCAYARAVSREVASPVAVR